MTEYTPDLDADALFEAKAALIRSQMNAARIIAERDRVRTKILGCSACELRLGCKAPVPFRGMTPAKIMMIGEAPGANEDEQGAPFVGAAGKVLERMVYDAMKMPLNQVFVTNTVACRPPKNRKPRKGEIDACRDNLFDQVRLASPSVVVTLGATPLSTFFPGLAIAKVHGRMIEPASDRKIPDFLRGQRFFASYHPAAAIYDRTLLDVIEYDLSTLGLFIREGWDSYAAARLLGVFFRSTTQSEVLVS